MELSARVPSSWQRRLANAIPQRQLVDGRYVLAIAVAALAAFLAAGFCFLIGDVAAFEAAKALPAWVIAFFRPITHLGYGGYFLWPTGILILLLLAAQRLPLGRIAHGTIAILVIRLSLLFSAVAVPGLITDLIKALIGRARPKFLPAGSIASVDPLTLKAASQSFPSGHTTVAFAVAVVLGAFLPRWRIPLFVFAALVGISRIVLQMHYPSDAIAGALVGAVFAIIVIRAFAARRLSLAVTPDGMIKPKPMPRIGRLTALAASILATLRELDPARRLLAAVKSLRGTE